MAKPKCPLLTVDAIIPYRGKVVLIQRKHAPFQGFYALPGGFVEEGETVENACIREAKEETGLDVSIIALLGVYSDPKRDPRGHVVSLVFVTKVKGGKLKARSDAASLHLVKNIPEKIAFDHAKILQDAQKKGYIFKQKSKARKNF